MWLLALLSFCPNAQPYSKPIEYFSKKYNFDPLLVSSVIYRESRFTNNVCYKGAHGLMQIQLKSRSCGKQSVLRAEWKNLYDPWYNIQRGVELLDWARSYCKSKGHKGHHWLLHYNHGIQVITKGRAGGYAKRILKVYKYLKKLERKIKIERSILYYKPVEVEFNAFAS